MYNNHIPGFCLENNSAEIAGAFSDYQLPVSGIFRNQGTSGQRLIIYP